MKALEEKVASNGNRDGDKQTFLGRDMFILLMFLLLINVLKNTKKYDRSSKNYRLPKCSSKEGSRKIFYHSTLSIL